MNSNEYVGKRVLYNGMSGVVKSFNESFQSIKVRFDNQKTQGFCIDDYSFKLYNNGVIHIEENIKPKGPIHPGPITPPDPPPDNYMPSNFMIAPSADRKIYHSTSFKNMLSIINEGGLLCRVELNMKDKGQGPVFDSVADQNILAKRAILGLLTMIPFHFKPKTPFDYAVFTKNECKKHNTVAIEDMVVIAIDKHQYDYCSYIFTAHPLSNYADRYNASDTIVPNLDFWNILDEYKNHSPHPTNKKNIQICMAEYNVNRRIIPLEDFVRVYVQTKEKADILLEHDKAGILRGKIVIGDKRYLI